MWCTRDESRHGRDDRDVLQPRVGCALRIRRLRAKGSVSYPGRAAGCPLFNPSFLDCVLAAACRTLLMRLGLTREMSFRFPVSLKSPFSTPKMPFQGSNEADSEDLSSQDQPARSVRPPFHVSSTLAGVQAYCRPSDIALAVADKGGVLMEFKTTQIPLPAAAAPRSCRDRIALPQNSPYIPSPADDAPDSCAPLPALAEDRSWPPRES